MIPVAAYMQLLKIASIEGVNRVDGIKAREESLKEWLSEWVEEVSDSQSIISDDLVSLENQDIIKYYLAGKLTEELMVDCVTIEKKPSEITTKVAAFRRRSKS